MEGKRVGVIRGGGTHSYQPSMRNGAAVLSALAGTPHKAQDIVVTKAGEWLLNGFVKTPMQAMENVDMAFIALQDSFEQYNQTLRLLDSLAVPYSGSGALSAAVAGNKLLTKQQAAALGFKTPKHLLVQKSHATDLHRLAHTIGELFPGEIVVKPQYAGASVDTTVASPFSPLAPILRDVLASHDTLLVEERIRGREATIGILEGYRNEPLYTFPPVEVHQRNSNNFFDYEQKRQGSAELICPGRFSTNERTELIEAAQRIHSHIGLTHYSRSDFIISDDGIYFLEINAVPEVANASPFLAGFTAIGGNVSELVEHLLSLADYSST